MKLVTIVLFFVATKTLSAQEPVVKSTADLKPIAPEIRDAARDAQDLALAKQVANNFAASIMRIRQSENIQDFSNWLLERVNFQLCNHRLQYGQLLSYFTKALLDKEKFPTQLQIDAVNAFTRDDKLSFVANARGFIFENDDRIILNFEKQADGSFKLSYGSILTCRET